MTRPSLRELHVSARVDEAAVATRILAHELGSVEGSLTRSRERLRALKLERHDQRELVGQTLQMALAGCQGRVREVEEELARQQHESAESIAQLEQELALERRMRAMENNRDDDSTGGQQGGSFRQAMAPKRTSPLVKRAGSEIRRIAELENELQAMHVKVDMQKKEIEALHAAAADGTGRMRADSEASAQVVSARVGGMRDIESARPPRALRARADATTLAHAHTPPRASAPRLPPCRADAIAVQQREFKLRIAELERDSAATISGLEERLRSLQGELAEARASIGAKEGEIVACERAADTARSQLSEAEAVLERRESDVKQLTSQLQVCILELKHLSEKSREAHSHQRHVLGGAYDAAAAVERRLTAEMSRPPIWRRDAAAALRHSPTEQRQQLRAFGGTAAAGGENGGAGPGGSGSAGSSMHGAARFGRDSDGAASPSTPADAVARREGSAAIGATRSRSAGASQGTWTL